MEVDSNVPEANMSDIYSDCNNPLTVTMKEYTNNGETTVSYTHLKLPTTPYV